eukprot:g50288.t1
MAVRSIMSRAKVVSTRDGIVISCGCLNNDRCHPSAKAKLVCTNTSQLNWLGDCSSIARWNGSGGNAPECRWARIIYDHRIKSDKLELGRGPHRRESVTISSDRPGPEVDERPAAIGDVAVTVPVRDQVTRHIDSSLTLSLFWN